MRYLTDTIYSRIPIHERIELPEEWIPADSRVEIDAKITAGKNESHSSTYSRAMRQDPGY